MSPREITPSEIEKFVKENLDSEEWRSSENTPKWISWMMQHECLDAFTKNGETLSVVVCSRKTTSDKLSDPFDLNPRGDCIAVDMIVSDRKQGKFLLGSIGQFLIHKHGMPDNVFWKRLNDVPVSVPSERIVARLHLGT